MNEQQKEPGDDRNGAVHADLSGASAHFRFRTERLKVASFEFASTCNFNLGGVFHKSLGVIDVSTTGLGIQTESSLEAKPGTLLTDFRFEHRGKTLWSGTARIANIRTGNPNCYGVQFLGPVLNLHALRFNDEILENRVGSALHTMSDFETLPNSWRARCLDLFLLLVEVRRALEAAEAMDQLGSWREPSNSFRLCEAMFLKTWPRFKQLIEKQEIETLDLSPSQVELGLTFAQRLFMLEYEGCEFPHRAYFKPQGYAGDYRMMELAQAANLEGESLFQRFVHYYAQHTSLGRTIKGRAEVALEAAKQLVDSGRPVRILSLACGPAVELRRLLATYPRFEHKVEIILVDQDESALGSCLAELNQVIGLRGDNPPIEIKCLHFSLRQLLAPKRGAERELIQEEIHGVDLIYSMGLFDYLLQPLARRTVARLASYLNPGGRLLVGNLMRVPDSSWQIEFATAWHLIYRIEEEMHDLASAVEGAAKTGVTIDETGHCLFLDVVRTGHSVCDA